MILYNYVVYCRLICCYVDLCELILIKDIKSDIILIIYWLYNEVYICYIIRLVVVKLGNNSLGKNMELYIMMGSYCNLL